MAIYVSDTYDNATKLCVISNKYNILCGKNHDLQIWNKRKQGNSEA